MTAQPGSQVGSLLRQWRERRRVSQLELALDAGVSTRHLSFVETGRSKPGREMLLAVLEQLKVPFRERIGSCSRQVTPRPIRNARSMTPSWRRCGRRWT